MISFKADLRQLNEQFEDPDSFVYFLENLDFSTILDSETISELALDAMGKNNSQGSYIKRMALKAWDDHKNAQRDAIAEYYID